MILSVSSQSVQREIPTRVTTLVQGRRNPGAWGHYPLKLGHQKKKNCGGRTSRHNSKKTTQQVQGKERQARKPTRKIINRYQTVALKTYELKECLIPQTTASLSEKMIALQLALCQDFQKSFLLILSIPPSHFLFFRRS